MIPDAGPQPESPISLLPTRYWYLCDLQVVLSSWEIPAHQICLSQGQGFRYRFLVRRACHGWVQVLDAILLTRGRDLFHRFQSRLLHRPFPLGNAGLHRPARGRK